MRVRAGLLRSCDGRGLICAVAFVLLGGCVLGPAPAWATEPPVSTSPPVIEGEVTVDAQLKGGNGSWEGTTPLGFAWQWLRCDAEGEECEPIPGAIEADRSVKELDLGSTLRLKVTASNKAGSASEVSTATAMVTEPEPPANTVLPSIEGKLSVGETLTAQVGTWSHHPWAFDYKWELCDAEGENCDDLEAEADGKLLLPSEAEGGRIRAEVTARNRGGEDSAETALSAIVGAMVAPTNSATPWVGFAEETKVVHAQVGEWAGGRPMSFAYQWFLCNSGGEECTEIPGATDAAYTPTSEDVGGKLQVKVTATNSAGSDYEVSSPIFAVSESEPWFGGDVEIEGEPVEEGELSADVSTLDGSQPIEVDYQWLRCFEGCDAIPSATAATYVPVSADVAHRLRVRVTARNSVSEEYESESEGKSPFSPPVEPAETEGPPRLADFPELEGLPRTGEILTSTNGVWRGAGEILTSVRWQRCPDGIETCEDIEGATESSYELIAEDTGSRIRAVVSASGEEEGGEEEGGGAEAGSRMTAPILPAEDTVWSLEGELSVEEVLEAAQEAEAPIVSIGYVGEVVGAYSGGIAGTEPEDVLDAIAETADPKALVVRGLTVSGDFTGSGEGEGEALRGGWDPLKSFIEAYIKHQHKTPSIRLPNDPQPEPGPEPPSFPQPGPLPDPGIEEPIEPSRGEPDLSLPIIESAELVGFGWDCVAPECEETGGPPWMPEPREVFTRFRWGIEPEEVLREIDEHSDLAFEFDVKLVNPHNSEGGLTGITCPDSESDDFWITDRDDMRWETHIPVEAGVYWDTNKLDPCNQKDITFGVYHPENLWKGESYTTSFYFNKAGNSARSLVEWHAELLERIGGCDDSPWCVNVEPLFDNYRLPQVIIPRSYRWDLPRCYEYFYLDGLRGVDECEIPV